MQNYQPTVLDREDTFFGVCEAIGEDFRFNAQYLRVGFALLLFFSPVAAIGGYAAAGAVVALSRWAAPNPRLPQNADEPEPVHTAGQEQQAELALAA